MGTAPNPPSLTALAPKLRIVVVASRWNEGIVERLLQGALERLAEVGVTEEHRTVFRVPGAVELPIVAQTVARKLKPDAVVVLGAVIRGETPHFDVVVRMAADGCQRVALDEKLPVVFGVLTVNTEEQAYERLGGVHGHKGREAVDAALETVATLHAIEEVRF